MKTYMRSWCVGLLCFLGFDATRLRLIVLVVVVSGDDAEYLDTFKVEGVSVLVLHF